MLRQLPYKQRLFKRMSLAVLGSIALIIQLLDSCTMASAVPGPIRLPKDEETFIAPIWSPDGRSIAMTGDDWSGIWIMKVDGTQLQQLAEDRGAGYKFTWSPDGRYIAYRAEKMVNGKRYFAIRIVDVETGHIEEVTDFQRFLGTPRWILGDGTVAFEIDRKGTLARAQIVDMIADQHPWKAPHLAAVTSRDLQIWICDASGDQKILISDPQERCFDPTLSPPGERVCYSVLSDGGSIAVAETNGSGRLNLGYGTNPSWSPDGRSLVCEVTEDDGMVITGSELYLIRADGSQRFQLTDTPDLIERWPSWSPDGTRIACSAGGAIYIVPIPESFWVKE
jgi:Tol biopolymer transport system component